MTIAKDAIRTLGSKRPNTNATKIHIFSPNVNNLYPKSLTRTSKFEKKNLLTEGAGDIFVPKSMVSSVGESLVTLHACFGGC